jgi:hypothetical protein
LTFVYAVAACATLGLVAAASAAQMRTHVRGLQSQRPATHVRSSTAKTDAAQASKRVEGAGRARLSEAEEKLVRDSKAAIIAQGLSEPYFDAHFKAFKVIAAPGDRRVVWRFEVNGHEAFVSDGVGYYTDARGLRVDTHSIADALPSAHDITRIISRRRAEQIMRACIGRFEGGAVVYRAAGVPERASLIFTATSAPRRVRGGDAAREREEREARVKKGKQPPQADVIEEGDDEGGGTPVHIGAVDLENGRCTKGLGVADHPAPERR